MESDTIRRDWLILIISIMAGGWFFFDYGNHHPLSFADASLGKQAVVNQGNVQLQALGYPASISNYPPAFQTRSRMLDEIQKKSDLKTLFSDSTAAKAFSPFYWNLNIFYPEDVSGTESEAGILDVTTIENRFQQRSPDHVRTVNITFNQRGDWMEFRNPSGRFPHQMYSEKALNSAFQLPDTVQAQFANDPEVPSNFKFALDRDLPAGRLVSENGILLINLESADKMARYYLESTGWPFQEMQLVSGNPMSVNGIEAAELLYEYQSDLVGQELQLKVALAPAGSLISLEAGYVNIDDRDLSALNISGTIRVFLLVIFSFWLFILLYKRVRLGVVDLKSATLFAVIAGIGVPVFFLLKWFYDQIHVPGSPGIADLIILFFTVGFSAAFVSMVYFVVTLTGESVSRQNQAEKIRTMDLIRMGYMMNRPTGTVCLHAVSFGLILAALWSLALWLVPETYIQTDNTFISDTTFFAPLVRILSILFLCFLTVQAIFLVLAGQFRDRSWNRVVSILAPALVFAFTAPVPVNIGPFAEEMILNGLIGLGLGFIFAYRDFLTAFISFFIFTLLLVTADGWLMMQSPDRLIFYPAAGVIGSVLLFGFYSISRGKSGHELPRYIPDYVDYIARNERINQELQIARKVQQSFLPAKKPRIKGLDISAICIPAYETGGDYYDFIELNDNQIAVMVGDVSGKGFQAAFYMTFIKGVLHALCQDYDSTVTILKKANKLFRENAHKGTFISLIFGIIDLKNRTFFFSRAGHNPLLYYRSRDKKIEVVKPPGLALGMTDGRKFNYNIIESGVRLHKDDILVLYTDGIVETMNWKREFYGDQRLQRMIYYHHDKSARKIVEYILKDVKNFSDEAKQHDDMTLLVIKPK